MIELYVLLVVLVLLSALFSGSEIALFSLSDIKVKKLIRSRKKGAGTLRKLKSNPHRLLVTILICNNVVNIAAASIATMIAIGAFGSMGVGIATGIITFLILIFGEITPKSYFHQKNERMSLILARPMYVLSMILYPIIIFIELISRGMLRLLGVKRVRDEITEEEIIAALSMGAEAGVIDKDEEEMMHNIIEFGDMMVKEVMTPRKEMVTLRSDNKLIDAITRMLETRYSRMPVFAHGTKNVMGIVNLRSMLPQIRSKQFDLPLIKLLSPVISVGEEDRLDDVFDRLRENAMHMAMVKNKEGQLVGLVTMEDLLEEIVGEIYDETDRRRVHVHFIDRKTAIIRGDMLVKDLKEKIPIPIKSKAATVSDLVSARFDDSPKKGQKIKLKNFIIEAMDVSKKDTSRVVRVKIKKRRGKIRK